jgi:GNAT superfamily N-acetyltransferase
VSAARGTVLRAAVAPDARAVADLVRTAKATAMPWLRVVHTSAEDLAWVQDVLLVEDEVVVAVTDGRLSGVLATRPGWVDQLHVLPERQGQGIGRLLLEHAKARSCGVLELWAFQRNARARRFYERAGFTAVEQTGGAANEEREPDVRYRWVRSPGQPGDAGAAAPRGPRLS